MNVSVQASLLINLHSRKGKRAYREILEACQNNGIEIVTTYKMGKGVDLEVLVRSIMRASPPMLLIAGGDGTVSRALGHLAGSPIEVGVIPLGTTNNFARSLNIPFAITDAIETIAQCKASAIDLGKIGQRHFANVVGIGMSAQVAKSVSDVQKSRWGRLAYAVIGLRCLLEHQPFMVTVTDKDNELELYFETHQVIVANGRYHAGQAIVDDARVDNHELIVFPIGGRGRLNFLIQMVKFYVGSRKSARHASYFIARDITIHTSTPQPLEVDGEEYHTSLLRLSVITGAVQVRYKKE